MSVITEINDSAWMDSLSIKSVVRKWQIKCLWGHNQSSLSQFLVVHGFAEVERNFIGLRLKSEMSDLFYVSIV